MSKGCQCRVKGGLRCGRPLMPGRKCCDQHMAPILKRKKAREDKREQGHHTYAISNPEFRGQRTVGPKQYESYLQSEEWKTKSRAERETNPNCSLCNRKGILHVHHRTYVRLGCEEKLDLIVLCSDCHALFHEHYKYDGRVGHFKPA